MNPELEYFFVGIYSELRQNSDEGIQLAGQTLPTTTHHEEEK